MDKIYKRKIYDDMLRWQRSANMAAIQSKQRKTRYEKKDLQ